MSKFCCPLEQSIQECTKETCGRQPLKYLKGYGLLRRPYPLKFFKGCLPRILLGPFFNTLSHMYQLIAASKPVWQNSTFSFFQKNIVHLKS